MIHYDRAWKAIMQLYLHDGLSLFFPEIAAEIDWNFKGELLNKEFHGVLESGLNSSSQLDLLVRFHFKSSKKGILLLHIEFQNQEDPQFETRVYYYNAKASEAYGEPVASLAILGDLNPKWRPSGIDYCLKGYVLHFRFPSAKLLDFKGREAELEILDNIFAFVVLIHLASMEYKNQPNKLLERKIALTKSMFKKGYTSKKLRHLLLFLEALIPLNESQQKEYQMETWKLKNMEPIDWSTPAQKAAITRARNKAVKEAVKDTAEATRLLTKREILEQQIAQRFGDSNPEMKQRLQNANLAQLDLWLGRILTASSLDDLFLGA